MKNRATSLNRIFCLLVLLATIVRPARASIGLVVGEPFGSFGTILPVGHAAIYLDHVCADTPTHLRPCHPGELGVVVSRYHDLRAANLDWMAVPILPFLYGVDDPTDTPSYLTTSARVDLAERYRQAHLRDEVPDPLTHNGDPIHPHYGDWQDAVGAAFDRRLYIYEIDTTPEQDATILADLNSRLNVRRYHLRRSNCADFAADLLNTVIPGALHRNVLGDFDFYTPKELARQLDHYGHTHPEANLRVYEIPQLPGALRRSRPLRGSSEVFVKTKRYLATLIVIQPEAILADWIFYETKDKWTPGRDATLVNPADWSAVQTNATPPINSIASVRLPLNSYFSSASTFSSTTSDAKGFLAK